MDNTLENILLRLLVPDNNVLTQATNELKEAFKNPAIIAALISTLAGSTNVQVRQYAALLLRRKVSKASQWSPLNDEIKQRLKQELMNLLISEPERLVKNSIAQVIGAIAKHELTNNRWPDLLFFLNQSTNSSNLIEREIGMFTFNIVTSVASEQLKPHLKGLITLFAKTIHDPSPTVASLTVQTLTNLVSLIGSAELTSVQALLPHVMNVIKNLISTDEEEAALSMDIFEELLEIEVSIIVPHIKNIIAMCLEIAANTTLTENIRVKALTVVSKVIRLKKKVVLKNNLTPAIIDTIFPIMCTSKDVSGEDNNDGDDDDDDEDSQSVDSFAPQVLDIMALHLPPEKLFPALMKHLEPALTHSNPISRKAGYTALAVLAEGCSEYIRHKYLHTFLQVICRGVTDQSSLVRNSALFALGQFAEYLQPEISEFHSELMPVLFDYLSNLCNQIQQGVKNPPNLTGVFFALEVFCENLDDRLLPYLPALMERLMMLLSISNSLEAKELAISAIGAGANAAKEAMVPYFPQIIEHLKPFLMIQPGGTALELQSPTLPVKVQAIDTLGVLARTLGPDTFKPMSQECIHMGLELVDKIHDPDIRRSVYSLFASISSVLKTDMEPYMPTIIDHMVDSLLSTEGIVLHYDETNTAFTIFNDLDDEENIEDDDDDDDDDGVIGHTVENSYLDEKEDTLHALREIAERTEHVFLPYFERCFQEVMKLVDHLAPDIRKPAVMALGQFTITLNKIAQQTNLPDQQNALNQTLALLVPKIINVCREDEERYVVLAAFETLGDLFKELKVLMLDHATLEAIVELVKDTFKHKLSCQDNSDFGEEDNEEAEYDGMLLEFAGELVPCMAKGLPHGHVMPYLEKILPCLINKTNPKCSVSERSFSVGTLAETVLALGKGGVNALVQPFLPLFLASMKDEDEEVRSNAVFGLGVLVQNAGELLVPQFPSLLQSLSAMLVKENDVRARDNVCSAVARLCLTNPSAVPLKQVFPVLLRCIPLQADFEENSTVYGCVFTLFFNQRDEILENLPQILKVISLVLHPSEISKLKDETKSQLVDIAKASQQDYQAQFQAVVSSLPSDGQGVLLSIVNPS